MRYALQEQVPPCFKLAFLKRGRDMMSARTHSSRCSNLRFRAYAGHPVLLTPLRMRAIFSVSDIVLDVVDFWFGVSPVVCAAGRRGAGEVVGK